MVGLAVAWDWGGVGLRWRWGGPVRKEVERALLNLSKLAKHLAESLLVSNMLGQPLDNKLEGPPPE